ncbi:hypothetical protein WAI453_009296 [Rhynchosporium graminicola]
MANVDRLSSYKGDVTEETVRNTQCPDELNSSLQNEGFPIGTSTIDVLSLMKFAAVRNIGIHPAIEGVFPSVAADITFFTREAAEYYFERGIEGSFRFNGMPLRFMWNKNICVLADRWS